MKKLVLAVMAVVLTACTTIPSYRSLASQVVPTNVELRAVIIDRWSETQKEVTYCSGVAISPTHILTAGHCVKAAQNMPEGNGKALWDGKIKIKLQSGIVVYGKISASTFREDGTADEARDVALLILDTPALKNIAPIGDSSKVQVGDTIFIVGNSHGEFTYTFSMGVVSYVGRTLEKIGTFIQTDTFAAPGNSGGPVFNASGELIGLLVRGGGGVQLVLPINDVLEHLFEELHKPQE